MSSKIGAGAVLRLVLGMVVEESWVNDVPEGGERGWDSGSVVPVFGAGMRREVRTVVKPEENEEDGKGESRFANSIVS